MRLNVFSPRVDDDLTEILHVSPRRGSPYHLRRNIYIPT